MSIGTAAGPARWRTPGSAILRVLAVVGLLLALACGAPAAGAAEPELTTFELSREEDGLYLAYAVQFELSRSVEDALAKGVPLFFVAEAEVYRSRWYWSDYRAARTVRTWRIVYQPLTSTYRVTYGGLSQTYASRDDALSAISRSPRWKIADASQMEEGARQYVEFSYRLETSLLPRPMQIGIASQADWSLAVRRTQRID